MNLGLAVPGLRWHGQAEALTDIRLWNAINGERVSHGSQLDQWDDEGGPPP